MSDICWAGLPWPVKGQQPLGWRGSLWMVEVLNLPPVGPEPITEHRSARGGHFEIKSLLIVVVI